MDYTMHSSIFITYDLVGFHNWPEAPDEVDYLRARHRHMFKTKIEVSVENPERQIEYHILRRAFETELFNWAAREGGVVDNTSEINFGSRSCESIAELFLDFVMELAPDQRYYRVEVSEDGENGSILEALA